MPTAGETSGVFGLRSHEVPALFGGDTEAADEPGELFAEAIPSAPDAEIDEELDIPIDVTTSRASPTVPGAEVLDESDEDDDASVDEGGGVAVPEESDAVAPGLINSDVVMPEPAPYSAPRSQVLDANVADLSSSDALISMDDIFASRPAAPAPAASAPSFGSGGVLPAPFLKPAASSPAPAPAAGGGRRPFTLVAVEGVTDGPFQLGGGEVYLLGRDKDAQVKILSTSVSRRHARIDATGADNVLIDLGSANGTQVNGQSVARHPLKEGDIIRMGKVLLRYTTAGS
jgi:hypothetical protein